MNSFWARRKRISRKQNHDAEGVQGPVVSSTTVRKRDNPRGGLHLLIADDDERPEEIVPGPDEARITFVSDGRFGEGRRMRRTIRHSDRPSIRAASIKDLGMASKLA